MIKSIVNIGKQISKSEQKMLNGGHDPNTVPHIDITVDIPADGGIDDSAEDCNAPWRINEHGRCVPPGF